MGAPTFLEVDGEKYLAFKEAVNLLPVSHRGMVKIDEQQLKYALALGLGLLPKNAPLGDDLFPAVTARSITEAHEAVFLRWKPDGSKKVQVRLTKRPADAKAYPGKSHCPGTAQRPGETEEGAFQRLARSEFCAGMTSRRKVGEFENFYEERGHYKHHVWLCEVVEGTAGFWSDTDALSDDIVDHHRDIIIPMAVAHFRAQELVK